MVLLRKFFTRYGGMFVVACLVSTIPVTAFLSLQSPKMLQDVKGVSIDPSSGEPAPSGPKGDWHLVFSDEFAGDKLDLTKWILCNPSFDKSCEPKNREKPYNAAVTNNKNVKVSGGQLHLIATNENGKIQSSMVSTGPNKFKANQPGYESFQFTYGYYEGRVKWPKGNGFWPSLWMLPDQQKYGCWAKSAEYDVVEIPGNDPTNYHFTPHWNAAGKCGNPHDFDPQEAKVTDTSVGFHTFGLDWQPDGLTWYFDGKKMGRTVTDKNAIKNYPFYIIANFAVGGTWGPLHCQGNGDFPCGGANPSYPASMDIDYLRVWQKGKPTAPAPGARTIPTAAPGVAPTDAPTPTQVVPTLYCLGGVCPSGSPTPTAVIATPAPTVPCDSSDSQTGSNSIKGLWEQLIALLNQLFALLTGGTVPSSNPTAVTPCQSTAPTTPPIAVQPTVAPEPTTAQPTTALSPTAGSSLTPSALRKAIASDTPVGINGALKVCGTHLCNQYNKPIQLRGVSTHGLQWFGVNKCVTDQSLDMLAKDWKADVVRAAMYIQEGGYETNPAAFRGQVDTIVKKVTDRGMYAIIDWHILTPGDPNVNLTKAKEFFTIMSQKYANQNNVIYEIANEPNGVKWSQIKTYADQVIPIIRKYDPDAVIIVGTPDHSSFSDAEAIIANPIKDKNVVYTYHFYAGSTTNYPRAADLAKKLPLFVTEWGTSSYYATGANDFNSSQKWVDMMAENKISWTIWSFADHPESGASLLPGTCPKGPWTTAGLKPSGKFVREKMMTPDNFPTN